MTGNARANVQHNMEAVRGKVASIRHYRFYFEKEVEFQEAVAWCATNGIRWRNRSTKFGCTFERTIYVRNKQRAALFKLRWSEHCVSWQHPPAPDT